MTSLCDNDIHINYRDNDDVAIRKLIIHDKNTYNYILTMISVYSVHRQVFASTANLKGDM